MRLGGSLDEIPVQGLKSTRLHHIAPWVRITDNAGTGKGATAFAKVVNGRIEKVIVENAGNSYLDPRIEILAAAPKTALLNSVTIWYEESARFGTSTCFFFK